ncbi:MAG: phospholipid carrier-dependent glycosyltransferase [bacterium]|nr:MAG: phospholipid carrier-dependent glycosyltransferase [bacterium]
MREKRVSVVVLIAVAVVAFFLRAHHIGYPPIGYHSMKEVHYLSVAKGYMDHGDFLHKRVLYSGLSSGPGYIEGFPQFQFLPLIYFALWKVFGVHVWIARFVVILFSLGTIVFVYKVCRELGGSEEVSLLASVFMSIMPISVFFGRNVQPDAVALFFILISHYFFLKWAAGFSARHLFYFSLGLFMAAIVKATFLFLVIPVLFVFPYGMMAEPHIRRKIYKQMIVLAPAPVLVFLWLLFTKSLLTAGGTLIPFDRMLLPESFTLAYWRVRFPIIWKYIGENYTFVYFSFFVVSLFWCALNFKMRLSKYIIGSAVTALLYFLLISDFAARHSYYHFPFLPMVCIGLATVLSEGVDVIRFDKRRYLKYVILAAIILLTAPSVKGNIDKHFDKLMLGTDVAGRYIRERGLPSDRIFISYGSPSDTRFAGYRTQFYGTLWEAGRRGALLPADLEKLQFCEKELGFRWIVFYKTDWIGADRHILNYITDTYSIVQAGFKEDELLYYLLLKGGKVDLGRVNDIEKQFVERYEFSFGHIDVYVKEP